MDLMKDKVEHEVDGEDVGGQPVTLGPLLGLLNEGDLLPTLSCRGSCLLTAGNKRVA